MYNPNFAISFINTNTGNAILDAGTSDLKTAKGAARNWYKNVGHAIDSFLIAGARRTQDGYDLDNIRIIMRPIDAKDDAINMNVKLSQPDAYIKREQRLNGATVITYDDLF